MARGSRGGRGRGRGRGACSPASATPRPGEEEDEDLTEETEESQETTNDGQHTTDTIADNKELKVDRRKPQLKAKVEPTPEPTPSAKKPGRPFKRSRGGATSAASTPVAVKNEPNSNSDGEHSESQTEGSAEPTRKRGRKPKEPIKEEDRYVPNTDSSKRGLL